MDLSRYLELYYSESQDHLRALGRGLLALELGDEPQAAVEEAFRAAHTIKSMSATMGFRAVTEICHRLEDRLDDVRAGRLLPSREVVDELLARADALEQAIQASVADPLGAAADVEAALELAQLDPEVVSDASSTQVSRAPANGGQLVRVRLRADAPMKAARAFLIVRALQQKHSISSWEPSEFGEDFEGEVVLRPGADADPDAIERELRAQADVESVTFEAETAGVAARALDVARATRHASTRLVRVDQARVDHLASGISELTVLQSRLAELAGVSGPLAGLVYQLNLLVSDLQSAVLSMRMVPLGDVFDRFPRVVRDAARALGKEVELRIEGRDIELDRSILDEIVEPLVHLLRNAVDHGLEGPVGRIEADKAPRGLLILRAIRERNSVRIELEDDGRGVDAARVIEKARAAGLSAETPSHALTGDELLRILSLPGFSTAEQITEVSGRGVGLDAVVTRVRALGGAIDLSTRSGLGSTFTIRLPITLAVAQALHVRVAGEDYAIPLTHVAEALALRNGRATRGRGAHEGPRQTISGTVRRRRGREMVLLRDDYLPLVRMRRVLGVRAPGKEAAAVIAEAGERRSALAVDELVGREQILVKGFDGALGTLPIFSGVTLLANGRPALVLDPLSVV
jgi:two-component system chemotaxis sensor kinase CheA